ncbi:MAG: radical SAM protein, partial [Gemmatimonadota bacterium]
MEHDVKIVGDANSAPDGAEAGSARRLARLATIDPRVELLSLPGGELEAALGEWLAARGEPAFRVGQIVRAIYQEHALDWDALTTLGKPLRAALATAFRFPSLALNEVRTSADGTQKYLWQLLDGEAIESVLIPTPHRDTICVSSQAGCALACAFCATGLFGYRRNLTAGEIVDQARQLIGRRPAAEHGVNVVFMGMGEPLLNWENLRAALDRLISERYLNIGARRITVS